MMDASKVEQELGIEVYATSSNGIGGVIRQKYEDFVVKEIPLPKQDTQYSGNATEARQYTVFWLEKRGLDTLLAVRKIAKELRVSEKRFSFAGMKDRNALTSQQVSAWNIPPDKLKELRINKIQIKEVYCFHGPVNIGSHWGNQFQIVVRNVLLPVNEVERRLQRTLEETEMVGGTPNYFGHQRFGLKRPITHLVGLEILKGNLENAAMVFLCKTSPHEKDEVTIARSELWETRNFKTAVRDFPSQLTYELAMLHRLDSFPDDFANAFKALPRRLLQMFVHATQSWLFNKFVSRRLKKNIRLNQCADGDLVAPLDENGLMTKETSRVDNTSFDVLNERVRRNQAIVVCPVPGFDMALPKGMMYDIVREVMDQEGIFPRSFWVNKMPEISSKGTFRPLMMIPKHLKVAAASSNAESESKGTFEFSLARGSYATVVLREFMKTSDPLAAGY